MIDCYKILLKMCLKEGIWLTEIVNYARDTTSVAQDASGAPKFVKGLNQYPLVSISYKWHSILVKRQRTWIFLDYIIPLSLSYYFTFFSCKDILNQLIFMLAAIR